MKNVLLQAAIKLNKSRKQRKWWQRTVRVMATVVVFCTTYALILPAITMEQETVCGMEAHTHTEDCYVQQPVTALQCAPETQADTVVHTHNELCYDAQGNLVCLLPETAAHTHDESCYTRSETANCAYVHVHSEQCVTTQTVLVCGKEETQGHSHSEACTGPRQVLTCGLTESEGHVHGDSCKTSETVLVCVDESHAHEDGCYQTIEIPCEIPEAAAHTHGEACYAIQDAVCTLEECEPHAHTGECFAEQEVPCELTTNDGHVHEEACYPKELTCTIQEVSLHTHAETCYDAKGDLLCTLPQVIAHMHTEACLAATEETHAVLACEVEEHVHEDACYPEEEENAEYLCGSGAHAHVETCYDEAGELICTIPVHAHEAACLVADLDLNADVETARQWEESIARLEFTGIWAEDLLTVAASQLDYQESGKNCVLVNDELKGYTRYGAWYGEPYGDWDDMFVAFCLNYAEISRDYIPYESDSIRWIGKLMNAGLYADRQSYTPVAGDLIFLDTDEDAIADHAGIVAELLPEVQVKIIAGDSGKVRVAYETYSLADEAIIGYGKLPQNPLTPEQWSQAEEVREMLAQLPTAGAVQESLETLNEEGDKAGYEALRQELMTRIEAIRTAYDALTEGQKARVGDLSLLNALQEVCGGAWQQFPTLTDDSAVISELTATGAEVIPAVTQPQEEAAAEETTEAPAEDSTEAPAGETNEETVEETIPENAVRNRDVIRYQFTAATQSYYSDVRYGQARVKLELVLPLTQDKALFDTEAMTWLEDSVMTFETRLINEQKTICQVLTGYKRLTDDGESGVVVPGSFTETIPVKVMRMAHGETVSVIISAAMEHAAWDGLCPTHAIEEKLTIQTEAFVLYDPLSAEEQDAIYRNYLSQIESVAALDLSVEEREPMAQLLLDQVIGAYRNGQLSDSELESLGNILRELLGYYAEYATGTGWMTGSSNVTTVRSVVRSQTVSVPQTTAMPTAVYNSLLGSSSQIDRNYNNYLTNDNQVFVRKSIAGTDIENVFDITLEVITVDTVNSVYEDPDMAVVVVMDISQTMQSNFPANQTTTTRYSAAMDSAQHFMENFAEAVPDENYLSKMGFVAFNTHGHEIFDLSDCATAADVATLNTTMRNQTQKIMDNAAKDNSYGTYASSHARFTNMEAGLKMANDMLANATNKNKYIIFLSDGFPTTYLKRTSSTSNVISSGYNGYDPYTGSGTNFRDGVFYDAVRGVHCDYGTSYSDTAAIYARAMAVSMKNQGVKIFSIGVDVASQTIKAYHDSYDVPTSTGAQKTFSVVERRYSSYPNNVYEIGAYDSTASFENWLRGSATTGIGSGYYYPSTNLAGLEAAYGEIFKEIEKINASSAHLDWTTTDPMPEMGVHELDTMEFIGFWNMQNQLVTELEGSSGQNSQGQQYENTATFDTTENTIHWDLKNSGYNAMVFDQYNTNYQMALRYRVRLKNENNGFIESVTDSSGSLVPNIYDTNDVTTLNYRIIEVVGDVTQVSDRKSINYPIPAVHGYLSELNFKKVGPLGDPLSGATFTLAHDTATCNICRGDGVSSVSLATMTAISDENGMVRFTRIPSGHHYVLTETEAPEGYIKTDNAYKVEIAYDALTVTVTDAAGNVLTAEDGSPLDWGETVENQTYYTLPETGSVGTSQFTFGGLLIIAAAALMYIRNSGRKRQKGGKYDR